MRGTWACRTRLSLPPPPPAPPYRQVRAEGFLPDANVGMSHATLPPSPPHRQLLLGVNDTLIADPASTTRTVPRGDVARVVVHAVSGGPATDFRSVDLASRVGGPVTTDSDIGALFASLAENCDYALNPPPAGDSESI